MDSTTKTLMKVAFYLPNKGLKNIDCRDLEHGNPEIGVRNISSKLPLIIFRSCIPGM